MVCYYNMMVLSWNEADVLSLTWPLRTVLGILVQFELQEGK